MSFKKYTPEEYMRMVGEAIAEVFGDKECLVIFFGSVVKRNMQSSSDIDVGIYCGDKIDSDTYFELLESLERLPILRDINIVDLSQVNSPEFLENIMKEGKIWIGSKELLRDLKRHLENLKKQLKAKN